MTCRSATRSLCLGLALALALALGACSEGARPASGTAPQRIVSLAPGLTEALFAIGAGDQVVGISDYCDFPPEARRLPRAGTMLTPGYEAVARLRPTRIVGERSVHGPSSEALGQIAPVSALPWLSLAEMAESTRELGRLTGKARQAGELARRLEETLSRRAPPTAPRVLLAIGDSPALSTVWYVKRGSLHDAALQAAGARNAVEEERPGPPSLSIEQVIALEPDAVVVLVASDHLDGATRQAYLDGWKRLSVMKAVQADAVRILAGAGVQVPGPRILELVARLQEELRPLPPHR